MGLNIGLYTVRPGERYGTEHPGWDSDKYAGDREFEGYCLSFNGEARDDPHYEGWGDVPIIYWRPADLQAAETWVLENLPAGGQERWLWAFEEMLLHPDLWFYSSW
jgi:hypothetical protein